MTIEIAGVAGLPEVREGDDLAAMIAGACALRDGDVIVITQKIVSKAEGRLVVVGADPATAAEERRRWIEKETIRVVARRGDILIAQTRHGFICANAGVDVSNVAAGIICLLPVDPDASARAIRDRLITLPGVSCAVIISDTFGRPWRTGQTNVAIGIAGMAPVRDHIGSNDAHGNTLQSTQIAVADEIAGAAELVMGKADQIPVAIVRGFGPSGDGSGQDLIRPAGEDLFRTGVIE